MIFLNFFGILKKSTKITPIWDCGAAVAQGTHNPLVVGSNPSGPIFCAFFTTSSVKTIISFYIILSEYNTQKLPITKIECYNLLSSLVCHYLIRLRLFILEPFKQANGILYNTLQHNFLEFNRAEYPKIPIFPNYLPNTENLSVEAQNRNIVTFS